MIIGIFGTGRNGSSLITRLLDGLGNTYVHPVEECFLSAFNELSVYRNIRRLTAQNCTTHPLKYIDKKMSVDRLRAFFAKNLSTLEESYVRRCQSTSHLSGPNITQVLPKSTYTTQELIDDYLGSLARTVRPDLRLTNYAFKTVETPYIADYQAALPAMRFVHIIRDPIAVCSSQKRSLLENKRLPASYLGYDWLTCMLVKRWIPHAKFITAHQTDPAHILVRYEDLVVSPDLEIKRIADFLGLSPPPRPDTQTIFCDYDMESWGFNPSKKGVQTPAKVVPNLQKLNQYDEILTTREIDLINFKASPYLEKLGYEVRPPAARATLFARHLLPDKWETMHCKTPRAWLRALFGMLYRRLHIVFS